MKKVLLAVLLLFTACSGFAQQKPAQENGFMAWVHDAWKTVQEQGRPAAEKIVRQFPKRFQVVKQNAQDLVKRANDKIKELDLEQKKNLVIELWRVRKSLDLLSLLQPEVLHSLTGLDTSGLANLESQVQHGLSAVQAAINIRR